MRLFLGGMSTSILILIYIGGVLMWLNEQHYKIGKLTRYDFFEAATWFMRIF